MAGSFASNLKFLWAGLVKQGQTGAIVPSQAFLIRKMIAPVPENYQGQIIELGPGTGAITIPLARRCPAARILACEINTALAGVLRKHLDEAGLSKRIEVVTDAAEHLLSDWAGKGQRAPDFVLSGIPLANIPREQTLNLIRVINQALAPNGMYIQYQHSLLDRKKIKNCFRELRTVSALFNFPPAFVYYARK